VYDQDREGWFYRGAVRLAGDAAAAHGVPDGALVKASALAEAGPGPGSGGGGSGGGAPRRGGPGPGGGGVLDASGLAADIAAAAAGAGAAGGGLAGTKREAAGGEPDSKRPRAQ
jgi:hypothetical protein